LLFAHALAKGAAISSQAWQRHRRDQQAIEAVRIYPSRHHFGEAPYRQLSRGTMKTFEVCKIFGRGFVVVVVSFAAAFLCAADVRAEQPGVTQKWPAEKILPPEPGRKACWRRVYDAKHLAAHPQQKITELTFFLRVSGYDAGGAYVFKNPHH